MSTCAGERAEAVAEQYVSGQLPEAEARQFEEHYLECDACFEHVRALQSTRQALEQKPSMKFMPPPAWAAFAVAAAAVMVIAVVLQWNAGKTRQRAELQPSAQQQTATPPQASPQPTQQEAPAAVTKEPVQLASLADKTLPPFHATQVRGASGNEHFDLGMRAYAAGDCATAIDQLKRVPRNSERAEAAAFYGGACQYVTHNLDAAGQMLGEAAKNQDSPFAEAARYYLAQVELQKNNSAGARHWLSEVTALNGDYETRARAQLQRLKSAR